MPKKNLLISAALTAFILVMVTGIASAYQRVNSTIEAVKVNADAEAARAEQSTADVSTDASAPIVDTTSVDPSAETVQLTLTHQEAALVAANFLGQTDLYSVENVVWEGIDAYEVVFSTGDSVFIGMTGEVLGTKAPETIVVIEEVSPSSSTSVSGSNARSSSSSSSSSSSYSDDDHGDGDHGDDDHEEHDDD